MQKGKQRASEKAKPKPITRRLVDWQIVGKATTEKKREEKTGLGKMKNPQKLGSSLEVELKNRNAKSRQRVEKQKPIKCRTLLAL